MPLSLEDRLRNFSRSREASLPVAPALIRDLLGGVEASNAAGSYYRIERTCAGRIALPPCQPERLRRNLRLLYGVGPRTEERLRLAGLDSLDQLLTHRRWSEQAGALLHAIAVRDLRHLRRRGARDRDVLSFFAPEDLVFIDIETTGLYGVLPLFLVGLLHAEGNALRLVQYLARRFDEEASILAAAAQELARFKAIVSYNGRAFDLPYLEGRFLAHRLKCRLDHAHIDLLQHARRRFRGRLPDCRLCTVETEVFAESRIDDVPGYLIPELYHQFVQTQDQAIVRGIVEHNALDLMALARLIQLVE